MKKALLGFSPIQLGALRIIISFLFLIIIGYKSLFRIQKKQWKWLLISGLLGTFFPSFLFAFTLNQIDSSIASILNSVTPFITLWIGFVFFSFAFSSRQLVGIVIGFIGTLALIIEGAQFHTDQNYMYALFPLIASIGYGFNVNIIKKHLQDLDALAITVGNFICIVLPAIIVLMGSDIGQALTNNDWLGSSFLYISILAIVGTGFAKIIFNKLIHLSTPIFSSSVTYLIPIIALMWGILDGERLNFTQLVSGIVILMGVYMVTKKKS